MAVAPTSTRTEIAILVNGGTTTDMARALCNTITEPFIEGAGRRVNSKVEDCSTSATEIHMMGNGFMEKCTAEVCWFDKVRLLRWNGSEENSSNLPLPDVAV
jgi:hypothetical protein